MTTALYRRYRPETFADVIGQEHVTAPLMAAISGGRVSHAYLFSGPRGCGKTTSARILARCLNCAQGPTPEPCGECDSCRELARGGSGSLDVVEIDAASHNGVDDARELRERAVFATARDRFKIFILDEAHMVSPQGFNALLKLVEEPPEHVKFIFATTEPEKVIGTIRSRTHHYPFRLVPPDRLGAYLEQICAAEGVEVGSGVLPLVVRAGGGSVRDALSVLDQLLAGADGALDYAQAVALLGYTPSTLLDDAVEALAAADGASVFRVVDRVVESGQEPRRFVEDLLQRLRDLIVLVAAGARGADAMRGVPADQLERMRSQADHLGLAQLSRAADLTNAALTEMTGATSPRLQLELLCARLLLPAADEPVRGFGARIERLEKAVEGGGPVITSVAPAPRAPVPAVAPAPATPSVPPPADDGAPRHGPSGSPEASAPEAAPAPSAPPGSAPPGSAPPGSTRRPEAASRPASGSRPQAAPRPPEPPPTRPEPEPTAAPAASGTAPSGTAPAGTAPSGTAPSGGLDTETVRRRWPEVLETLSRMRRVTWTITSQNAQVLTLDGTVLRLRFDTPGIASTFRSGSHPAAVEQALRETLGLQVKVEAVAGDATAGDRPGGVRAGERGGGDRGAGDRADLRGAAAARTTPTPDHAAMAAADWSTVGGAAAGGAPSSGRTDRPAPAERAPSAGRAAPAESSPSPERPDVAERAPSAGRPGAADRPAAGPAARHRSDGPGGAVRPDGERAPSATSPAGGRATGNRRPAAQHAPTPPEPPEWEPPEWEPPEDEPSLDDPDLDDSSLVGAPLVEKLLGGTVIDEISLGPGGTRPPGAP